MVHSPFPNVSFWDNKYIYASFSLEFKVLKHFLIIGKNSSLMIFIMFTISGSPSLKRYKCFWKIKKITTNVSESQIHIEHCDIYPQKIIKSPKVTRQGVKFIRFCKKDHCISIISKFSEIMQCDIRTNTDLLRSVVLVYHFLQNFDDLGFGISFVNTMNIVHIHQVVDLFVCWLFEILQSFL